MREGKYGKYFISEPRVENVAYHPVNNVKGVTFPDEIYLDGEIKGVRMQFDSAYFAEIIGGK